MSEFEGFVRILATFYSVFHPTEGPKVVFQVPPGSVTPSLDPAGLKSPLIDFDAVKSYIIPKQPLCHRVLSLRFGPYSIISYPVYIPGQNYPRNFFAFNFCFIFYFDDFVIPYFPVVRKLAHMFSTLEEQNLFLTRPETQNKIESVLEQIFEDLNNYCECMIPIDTQNTINIKLFPLYPPPPDVKYFHVPIATVPLKKLANDTISDSSWDPIMLKLIPFIDGINSIARIADLADTDYSIAKQCVQHLMYYDCLIVVDIFQFKNIYAPTADLIAFAEDIAMQQECANYVASPGAPIQSPVNLLWLYRSLHQGQNIKDWMIDKSDRLHGIDVRRFLSFGVIKRIIYRVHTFPVLESLSVSNFNNSQTSQLAKGLKGNIDSAPPSAIARMASLPHHLDWLCTELHVSYNDAIKLLKKYGKWTLINA